MAITQHRHKQHKQGSDRELQQSTTVGSSDYLLPGAEEPSMHAPKPLNAVH